MVVRGGGGLDVWGADYCWNKMENEGTKENDQNTQYTVYTLQYDHL